MKDTYSLTPADLRILASPKRLLKELPLLSRALDVARAGIRDHIGDPVHWCATAWMTDRLEPLVNAMVGWDTFREPKHLMFKTSVAYDTVYELLDVMLPECGCLCRCKL